MLATFSSRRNRSHPFALARVALVFLLPGSFIILDKGGTFLAMASFPANNDIIIQQQRQMLQEQMLRLQQQQRLFDLSYPPQQLDGSRPPKFPSFRGPVANQHPPPAHQPFPNLHPNPPAVDVAPPDYAPAAVIEFAQECCDRGFAVDRGVNSHIVLLNWDTIMERKRSGTSAASRASSSTLEQLQYAQFETFFRSKNTLSQTDIDTLTRLGVAFKDKLYSQLNTSFHVAIYKEFNIVCHEVRDYLVENSWNSPRWLILEHDSWQSLRTFLKLSGASLKKSHAFRAELILLCRILLDALHRCFYTPARTVQFIREIKSTMRYDDSGGLNLLPRKRTTFTVRVVSHLAGEARSEVLPCLGLVKKPGVNNKLCLTTSESDESFFSFDFPSVKKMNMTVGDYGSDFIACSGAVAQPSEEPLLPDPNERRVALRQAPGDGLGYLSSSEDEAPLLNLNREMPASNDELDFRQPSPPSQIVDLAGPRELDFQRPSPPSQSVDLAGQRELDFQRPSPPSQSVDLAGQRAMPASNDELDFQRPSPPLQSVDLAGQRGNEHLSKPSDESSSLERIQSSLSCTIAKDPSVPPVDNLSKSSEVNSPHVRIQSASAYSIPKDHSQVPDSSNTESQTPGIIKFHGSVPRCYDFHENGVASWCALCPETAGEINCYYKMSNTKLDHCLCTGCFTKIRGQECNHAITDSYQEFKTIAAFMSNKSMKECSACGLTKLLSEEEPSGTSFHYCMQCKLHRVCDGCYNKGLLGADSCELASTAPTVSAAASATTGRSRRNRKRKTPYDL